MPECVVHSCTVDVDALALLLPPTPLKTPAPFAGSSPEVPHATTKTTKDATPHIARACISKGYAPDGGAHAKTS